MALELNLETIQQMNRAEYIKAFKNKSLWKIANAVIFLVDYKLDGKKSVIAIPFRKEVEMKLKMKEIKKSRFHLLKKTGAGFITVENDGPEGLKAKVELVYGGLKPEVLQERALELFQKINATLEVLIADEAELETENTEEEENGNSEPIQTVKNPSSNDVKLIVAEIVKLNKQINLKDGLNASDIETAEALKDAIKSFAAILKISSQTIRSEFGDSFLKTKMIYAKIEQELKKLQNEAELKDIQLENALDETLEHDGDDNEDKIQTVREAISRNDELFDEIFSLAKELDLN